MKKQVVQEHLMMKIENEQKIKELRLELSSQEAKLEEVTKKLHSTQALMSKQKVLS